MRTRTNRSGGVQGGISNGEDIVIRVAFKPTSTIGNGHPNPLLTPMHVSLPAPVEGFWWLSALRMGARCLKTSCCWGVRPAGLKQNTVTREGEEVELRARGRHDACVVPRAGGKAMCRCCFERAARCVRRPGWHHASAEALPLSTPALCVVVLHAVPMVESMVALVLADQLLQHYAQCELLPRNADTVGADPNVAKQFAQAG